MRKKLSLLLLAFLLLCNPVFAGGLLGEDGPSEWAVEEIDKGVGVGLIPEDMLADFHKTINREEFCVLSIRLIEVNYKKSIDAVLRDKGLEKAPSDTFVDCSNPSVLAAKALGITDGVGNRRFAPNATLTREQAAKFLSMTAKACDQNINSALPTFNDLNDIADWAKPYVAYVFYADVMKGVGNNTFAPKGTYERQQAFVTMFRLLKKINPAACVFQGGTCIDDENYGVEPPTVLNMDPEVEKLITYKPYEKSYKMTYEGSTSRKDKIKIDLYYDVSDINKPGSPIRTREDYRRASESSVSIYYDPADYTYIKFRTYLGQKPVEMPHFQGNKLDNKVLDPDEFESIKTDGEIVDISFDTLDGERVIYIKKFTQSYTFEYWYSIKYMRPIKVHYVKGDESIPNYFEYEYKMTNVEELESIDENLFDINKITL